MRPVLPAFITRPLTRLLTWLFRKLGYAIYSDLKEGRMSGSVVLLWVGESTAYSGSGRFVYVPFPGDELRFTFTSSRKKTYTLKPEPIYTDGGSIPRPAQMFKGFSPWDYAPAYVLHDWVFVAKRCQDAADTHPASAQIGQMTFKESAELMGAALRTLARSQAVYENNVAKTTITGVVNMGFSRKLWGDGQSCQSQQLEPPHARKVAAFIRKNTPKPLPEPYFAPRIGTLPFQKEKPAPERGLQPVDGVQVMGVLHAPKSGTEQPR